MCHVIKAQFEKTGEKTGFKPAGGIITAQDAVLYYTIVKTVLGDAWLTPKLFRLGASRLANNLLTELTGKTVNYF
jgi:deoxyribose-phosphate aldolase